jgi:hypothetical protein
MEKAKSKGKGGKEEKAVRLRRGLQNKVTRGSEEHLPKGRESD